jgi:membrane protease YdiL (CAAX protease family)
MLLFAGVDRLRMTQKEKYCMIGFVPASRPSSAASVLLRFFAVLFVGAIILGPLLFFSVRGFFPLPFHRAMDRALLISALAALGFVWPRVDLRAWWPFDSGAWKQALLGLGIALVSTQLILGLEVAFAGLGWAQVTTHDAHRILFTAIVAALLVPFAEETIFRGFIQTKLVRGLGAHGGIVFGALIFMLAHFLKVPAGFDHAPVHGWSGASALGAAFLPVLQGQFLDGRGLNLFLLGLILGGLFLRWGTLWLNYGLHGGLILALILASGLTRPAVQGAFWAGDGLLSSLLTSAVLVLLGFWLWFFYRRHWPESDPGPTAP